MSEIADEHVKAVCKIGQGAACCRYLTMGPDGFGCEKFTQLAGVIDGKVERGTYSSVGDNCDGWGGL